MEQVRLCNGVHDVDATDNVSDESKMLHDAEQYWVALARSALPPLATAGDPHAQHMLAVLLSGGKGGPADKPAAIKWWEASAEQGFARAHLYLGKHYRNVALGNVAPAKKKGKARVRLGAAGEICP
jgi:TPR repeat protein